MSSKKGSTTTTTTSSSEEEMLWLKEGAHIEVSSEEEGFRGSWYSATVLPFRLSQNNNNNKKKKNNKSSRSSNSKSLVYVEFDHLVTSDDEHKRLRELIDVILVRPIPPPDSSPHRLFQVSDEVDAYHSDGWWEGIVISVLDHGSRYSVFFRTSREQIDFPQSDLRIHREWVRGNWIPPLEQQDEQADENYAAK